MWLIVALFGCNNHLGYSGTVDLPDDTDDPEWTPVDTAEQVDTEDTWDSGWYYYYYEDTGEPPPEPPRMPYAGELVISELMIDPTAVTDDQGEYIELTNTSGDRIELEGCVFSDDDVDLYEITASVIVEPGDRAVLCAARSANGGVSCDGTFVWAMSEALALSNTGDELELTNPNGARIDRLTWSDSFVTPGVAMGLDPARMTAAANDSAGNWCEQQHGLSGGDHGTPGSANDGC